MGRASVTILCIGWPERRSRRTHVPESPHHVQPHQTLPVTPGLQVKKGASMGRGLVAESAVCFSLETGPACRFPNSRGTRPLGCGVWLGFPRCPPTAGLAVGTPVVCPWSRRVQCLATRRRAQEADGGLSPIWGSAWTAMSELGCATSWSGGRDRVGSNDHGPRVRRVCAGVVGLWHRQGPPCHPGPALGRPPPPHRRAASDACPAASVCAG